MLTVVSKCWNYASDFKAWILTLLQLHFKNSELMLPKLKIGFTPEYNNQLTLVQLTSQRTVGNVLRCAQSFRY